MLTLLATVLVILAFGDLASLVAVISRYAIPKAPKFFHWLLLPPMLITVTSCFSLAWMALAGPDEIFGITALVFLALVFGSQSMTAWILNAYAIYYFYQVKNRRRM